MIRYSLYVVDDDPAVTDAIEAAFMEAYDVTTFATAEPAVAAAQRTPPDLVLLDLGLPGMNGLDALRTMKALHRDLLIIVITGQEDISSVIAAMRAGAHDYVVKPLHLETLEVNIRNALDTVRLAKEVRILQEQYLREHLPCFVAESGVIREVMESVELIARSPDTPVLIIGDTGTGKELIASTIHYRSPNFRGPFVTVNCAAIPTELVESELFGYQKGAFTGANLTGKKGLVEQAAGGTLFLDEVGDLGLEAQAKMLRFLEQGEFFPVGGTKTLRVSTRVISATNKDLVTLMRQGHFREDLYYRLSTTRVEVPCLTSRPEDILPIANTFLIQFAKKFGKTYTGFAPDAVAALKAHVWKGNVRELRNAIEGGVLMGTGPLLTRRDIKLLPAATETDADRAPTPWTRGNCASALGLGTSGPGSTNGLAFPPLPPEGIDFHSLQQAVERHFIQDALRLADGHDGRAASLLRMNYHTFRYQKKKLLNI